MPSSPRDDAEWERVWREADDEFLIESAKDHLWQNFILTVAENVFVLSRQVPSTFTGVCCCADVVFTTTST
jgi:hypothetical protein